MTGEHVVYRGRGGQGSQPKGKLTVSGTLKADLTDCRGEADQINTVPTRTRCRWGPSEIV